MRGAPILLALALLCLLPGPPASARPPAADGYDSLYAGESAFTAAPADGVAQLTAIFFNSGALPWQPGVVGLLVCAADRSTCGAPSPYAAYEHGWYSASVYATLSRTVTPGQTGFFSYEIAVPSGTAPGTSARFDGEVGLIDDGLALHPEGYYHENVAPAAAATLVATLLTQPIPADDRSSSVLRVDVLGPGREPAAHDFTSLVTATRGAGDEGVCVIDGAGSASAIVVAGRAEFTVQGLDDAGLCHLTITADPSGLRATATLETRHGGTPTRLTVSGTSSPQAAGGAPITVAVDIDDVNVALVVGDQTTMVHLSLDESTCTGAPGGDAYVPSGFDVPARDGRAWFVLRSSAPYGGCRGTVTSPGLIGNTFVVVFAPKP